MLTKNFSTQTVESSSCWFRRDYSYRTNPNTCLKCDFCYKLNSNDKERRRSSKYIDTNEKFHSATIFKTPVIISRFCEPFVDGHSSIASVDVAEKCINNGSQFIFKTALSVPKDGVDLLVNNKDKVQCQLRFIADDSNIGVYTTQQLSPGFNQAYYQLKQGAALVKQGVDVVAIFDPFIIGVNDTHCINLVKQLEKYGIKKLIIKQLFATDYFLKYLKLRIDRRYTNILSVHTSGFWTYDNVSLIKYLYPVFEQCVKCGIVPSICSNRGMNELIYGNKNCCQFETPIGFYNKEGNIIND